MKQMSGYQKMTGRKLVALLCSLMLLISSSGITAFADDGIYSDPVTAPGSKTTVTPTPETTEETPADYPDVNPEENPVENAEPAEGDPEVTEDPDAQEEQNGGTLPEDDGIVYQAGSLMAELEDCSALIEYTADARIPEETTLTLRKAEGMESYACLKSANKLLKNQEDETWKDVLAEQGNQFYYLSLTNAEGEEIKPASGVILTFQKPESPEGVSYVLTGEAPAFLENNDGIIRIVDYAMDPLGYVTINKEQIGNVTLTHKGADFTVTATYGPDAGFPAETEMQVREILPGTDEYTLYSGMTDEALNEDWAKITLERYFDIAFVVNGEEREPQGYVDVQILFSEKIEKNEETEVQAVHIQNNEATIIESETDSNEAAVSDSEAIDTVTFSSDSFSVYGVVQKKKISQKVLAADGNTYEINVTYGPEAEIPEGAELKVEEIPEGSDLWEAYRKQTAAALGAADVRLPGLYDITILFEGREVEPKAPISVAITLANAETGNEELNVVHFKEEIPQELVDAAAEEKAAKEQNPEKQAEVLLLNQEEQIDSEKIDANVDGQTVTFETEGFSVYAFAYTIDTYYKTASGETYQITLKYGNEAQIPAGAELKVEEIPEGSELWEAYRKQTAAALGADDVRMPGLFDISIVDGEGNKVEPKAPVNVAFRLIKEESLTQDLRVVHFKEEIPQELVTAESKAEEPATEETENQPQAQTEELNETQVTEQTEAQVPAQPAPLAEEDKIASETISASVEGDTITFDTDGFSVYAFAYTVDFHYVDEDGNVYEWSYPGRGKYPVTDIVISIGGEGIITDATLKLIKGEYVEGALYLTKDETGEWYLNSDVAFLDTYELNIHTNKTIYALLITDAQDSSLVHFMNNAPDGGYFNAAPGERVQNSRYNGRGQLTEFDFKANWSGNAEIKSNSGYHYAYTTLQDNVISIGTLSGVYTWRADKNTHNGGEIYISYFVPDNQYLIRYVAAEHGRIVNADKYVKDPNNQYHYFSYSGDELYAQATADSGYVFAGWYQGDTFLSADEYLNLSDVTNDMVITARFRPRETYEIKYHSTYYYTCIQVTGANEVFAAGQDGAWASEYVTDGGTAKGATATTTGSRFGRPDMDSYFIAWVDSDGNHVSNSATFIPTGDQIKNTTYTAVFSSSPDYVVIDCDYHCGTVGGTSGLYSGIVDLEKANTENNIVFAKYNNNGNLLGDLWPIPNEGYLFDHWEWTPDGGSTVTIQEERIYANNSTIHGKGTLKAVFKPHITYDVGVINRVGINAPDTQRWYNNVSVINATPTSDANIFTETVNSGSDLNLKDKLSSETRVTQTTNGYNLLTHYIKGWTADRNVTVRLANGQITNIVQGNLIPADATILNITEALKLTAVWSSTFPGKKEYNGGKETGPRYNTNSVGFFVRIVDNVADIGDTSKYTTCLYTSRLLLSGTGDFATNNNTTGNRHDFFGNGRVTDLDMIERIDRDLRANHSGLHYSGTTNPYDNELAREPRYDGAIIGVESFPSDQTIFAQIRAWNARQSDSNKITVSGIKVQQHMLNSNYFEIKWYVLKDQENQWHIDGMLIPKPAKLVIKKTFAGNQAAIDYIKTHGFYLGVDDNQSDTNNGNENYKLSLQPQSSSNPNGYISYDSTLQEYTWLLEDLLPLKSYWVAEHNYSSSNPKYIASKSYQITNTNQANRSGTDDYTQVLEVYPYAANVGIESIQTVAYTNVYSIPYVMTILKQDGTTLHGLDHVKFDLVINNDPNHPLSGVIETENGGKFLLTFPQQAGTYSFSLTEQPREGYNAIHTVTGTANVDSEGKVTLTNVQASVTGENSQIIVDSVDQSIVRIINTPERVTVTVEKTWIGNDNKPVAMQLLRNGIPVTGKNIVLLSSQTSTAEWPRTSGSTWTWADLPAYVDGNPVHYTVLEEWIGEPGGNESVYYNHASDSADGYDDYIVSQTMTTSASGDLTIVTVHVENTKDDGQIIFTKKDVDSNKALTGAVFEIYKDLGIGHGPDTSAEKIGEYTSNEIGVFTITGLTDEWYWMREKTAPDGYALPKNTWYLLQIKKHDSVIHPYMIDGVIVNDYLYQTVTTIPNTPYTANIKVIKTGVNEKTLAGAYFTLYDEAILHVINASQPTDANGELTLDNLPAGTYKLVEDTAPTGYIRMTDPITITVSADGTVTTIPSMTVTNTADNNFSVTVPNEPELTTVTVQKTWDDAANLPTGTEVTVQLSATVNNTAYTLTGVTTEQTLTGESEPAWQYTWSGLPKYDEDQNLIVYSVTETRLTIGTETIAGQDLAAYIMTADEADTAYSFHLKNRIPRIQKTALKKWSQNTLPEGISVKFKIKATIGDSTEDIFDSLTGTQGAQEQTLVGGRDATVTANWKAVWSSLPQYYQGQKINYTVSETEYKIGNVSYPLAQPDETAQTGYDFSFTNTLPETEITVQKIWKDGDTALSNWPEGIESVQVGLLKKSGAENEFTPFETESGAQKTVSISASSEEFSEKFEHLPVYDENGDPITYAIEELSVTMSAGADPIQKTDGLIQITGAYENTWSVEESAVTDNQGVLSATVTNTLIKTNLDIVKVKPGTPTGYEPLTGAKFKLEKQNVETWSDYKTYGEIDLTTESSATIEGLTDGSYRLSETQTPNGFNGMSGYITFTVLNGAITDTTGTTNPENSNTIVYANKDDQNNAQFQIINTPGVVLPGTGGSGTLIYTIAGLALILLAGVLLISRRKWYNNR